MTDFLIDVGNQGNHSSHNFSHAKGCWRQLSRGSCDRTPNPGSPSGMCTWHWLEWGDDDVWEQAG